MKMHLRYLVRKIAAYLFPIPILAMLLLQSCVGASMGTNVPTPTMTTILSSPIPPFVATDQAAAIQARSTIQAGEAMAFNLSITGTAAAIGVNMESTRVALELTKSAATESYFSRQTQTAGDQTATAVSSEATGIAGTKEASATSVAWTATAIRIKQNDDDQRTITQLAINELIREDKSQSQSLEFRTWVGRVCLVLAFVFGLVLIWRATPWMLLKFFGFQSWNGKPIVVVPDSRGGVKIVDIARSMGPGIVIDARGKMQTTGLAPNAEMQNAVTARAQAAELMLATGNMPADMKKRLLQQAAVSISPAPKHNLPPEISNIEFKVLPPEDSRVKEWLSDVEDKLLDE